MKKVLFTILTFICCCMLVITSLFSFNSINKAGAVETSQTYNYTGELDDDYSGFGDFAIDDIQYLETTSSYEAYFTINNTTTDNLMLFQYLGTETSPGTWYFYGYLMNFVSSIDRLNYGIAFYQEEKAGSSTSGGALYCTRVSSGLTTYYLRPGRSIKIIITNKKLSFSDGSLVIGSIVKPITQRYFTEDFSSLFDMSADTSFVLDNYYNSVENYGFSHIINYIRFYGDNSNNWFFHDYPYIDDEIDLSSSNASNIRSSSSVATVDLSEFGFDNVNFQPRLYSNNGYNGDLNFDFNFTYSDFYFYIKKPAYRVNNSLLIYNFDYQDIVSSVDYVRFQLSKDGDYYNVTYNGNLPNSKYIEIFNTSINNITFDEYIFLYLGFDKTFTYSYYGDYSQAESDILYYDETSYTYSLNVPLDFGFDFNFNYYTQPLVTNKGSYKSYRFKKPGYVDMPFSLAPFYIPVLEIAENVMIFLVFYCPLISDVLELIYFDRFFGALLQLFNFIFGSAIGSFILGCLAFTIFWSLLKGLFPVFISSGSRSYKEASDLYDEAIDSYNKPSRKGRLRPYRSKSSLGSSSRKRYSSFTKINSDKSKKMSPQRRHAKNFKFDNIDDIEI